MKSWIYVGIFLDEESAKELKELYQLPDGWKEYYDHMTVVFNDDSELSKIVKQANAENIGEFYPLKAVAIGISDKAMALKVELPIGVVCANEIPHITLGTSPEGSPVDSNDITIWNTISEPLFIGGTMRVYRGK